MDNNRINPLIRPARMGRVAVIGSGSWATALARLLLNNCDRIGWYVRRPEAIDEFIKYGHNPSYLTDVRFDSARIDFSADVDEVIARADTLVLAVPSPYVKPTLDRISEPLTDKRIISAVKGIVPDRNMIVTDYLRETFGIDRSQLAAIGGPCHAEEVALQRLSYLTIGGDDRSLTSGFASLIAGKRMKTILSDDMDGIEYGAVLKNVYGIAGGIVHGMKAGDNFMAMMVSNAIREMRRFVDTVSPIPRDICRSAYLGDLLVTAYSRFSRNHNFGSMIGKGYSVKAAKMEMEMVAEGYYGTKCIFEINSRPELGVEMPILDAVHDILYRDVRAREAFEILSDTFV